MSSLGNFLKELRGEELSLKDVEKGAGISSGLIWDYERGEKIPGTDNLLKLAEYYEVPYEEIRAKYYVDTLADERERVAVMKALEEFS